MQIKTIVSSLSCALLISLIFGVSAYNKCNAGISEAEQSMATLEKLVATSNPKNQLDFKATFLNGKLILRVVNTSSDNLLIDHLDWKSLNPNIDIDCIDKAGRLLGKFKNLRYDRKECPLINTGIKMEPSHSLREEISTEQIVKTFDLNTHPKWVVLRLNLRVSIAGDPTKKEEFKVNKLLGPIKLLE